MTIPSDPVGEIRRLYMTCRTDASPLFEAVLEYSKTMGLDRALSLLEGCVTEKRIAWYQQTGVNLPRSGDLIKDGFRLFYDEYLHVRIPEEGEIVFADRTKIVSRWWNTCPTLNACRKLGLDTRVVCRAVYHDPVETLLTRLDPRLRFDRNYACIRPYADFCEETIFIKE